MKVFFIGGYGDPGTALGPVKIYDLKTGAVIGDYDLKKQIPDLEDRTRQTGKETNFPWVLNSALSADGKSLFLKPRGGLSVEINPEINRVDVRSANKWFTKAGCDFIGLDACISPSPRKIPRTPWRILLNLKSEDEYSASVPGHFKVDGSRVVDLDRQQRRPLDREIRKLKRQHAADSRL